MKPFFTQISCFVFFCLTAAVATGQNSFFKDASESSFNITGQKRVIVPSKYRTLNLDKAAFASFMKTIPLENSFTNRNAAPSIEIPMPGGEISRFHIWESSVMDSKLAAKYPGIKTFTGQGIDDPTATIKLDWTPFGFHAMILSTLNGSAFVDPYAQGNTTNYISYFKHDFIKAGKYIELPVTMPVKLNRTASPTNVLAGICTGTQLRKYRLALAADAEYTAYFGGVAGAHAAIVTTMNRVNGIYERDLAVRMILIANNDLLIYTDPAKDPYSNNDGNAMLDENQHAIDSAIGNANYDIGHVFSTGGGGVAYRAVVCYPGFKAGGVTGSSAPVGDPFNIDYVAHEMGHQFGASHTFGSNVGACGGSDPSFTTNVEPGSGSTIMAYAGICGSDDLQSHSDAQFHGISLNEITDYITNGMGSDCAVITQTGNTPPAVNAGANYVIPKSTPFVLTGSGSDANGDVLTYDWEQMDAGGPFNSWDQPSGDAPLFRSFIPKATPARYFPQLSDVNGNTTTIGELLPSYGRIMHFRLTARDNRAGGGGVCFAETAVTVDETGGPFLVTYPNAAGLTWLINDFKTITWDVAGTIGAPVNCANVKIEMSVDGGLTYPVTIAASTPNDGSQEIQVPNNFTNQARIRITGVGNIFYDISNFNSNIQNSSTAEFVFNNPQPVATCGSVSSATANIKTAALKGFATPITLSASGNPAGTTVSFGTNPLAPGANTTVTLNNIGSLPTGTYNVTINGTAGSVIKSRIISFVINGVPTTSFTSNLTGTSYQWQVNTGSGFTNITNDANYAGANSKVLQITNAPTQWTSYQYRAVVDGINSKIFTLGYTNYWNGTVSNAWENAANWSCGTVPNASTDVVINNGAVVVNSSALCHSLNAKASATISVNAGFQILVVQ